jgi:hypothetical protein
VESALAEVTGNWLAEREVTSDLEQRRGEFRGALFKPFAGVKAIKYSLRISDYERTEFDGALIGTIFGE